MANEENRRNKENKKQSKAQLMLNNVSANNMAAIVGELPVIRHCFIHFKSFNFTAVSWGCCYQGCGGKLEQLILGGKEGSPDLSIAFCSHYGSLVTLTSSHNS